MYVMYVCMYVEIDICTHMNKYIFVGMKGQTLDQNPMGLQETRGAPPPASHEVISVSHGWDMFLFSPSMGTISELLQDGPCGEKRIGFLEFR